MTAFIDAGDLTEDQRIDAMIGLLKEAPKSSSAPPFTIAFIVEDDEKADRYIRKLQDKFPEVRVVARGLGPVPNTVTVKIAGALA